MTALGMADQVTIMAMAIICAVAIMIWASGPVANFVNRHPTVRILALCFLLLVGMTLVADGSGYPVPKGFIYAAIAFSSLVEGLNQIARRRSGGSGIGARPAGEIAQSAKSRTAAFRLRRNP
jgi:predicted tellurium resistance membrane protein TerC